MNRIKTWDELTIQDNYLFQKVMRKEPGLLHRLLERLLGFSIRKISIPQTEKTIETDFRAKGVRLDVYVEDENGRVYDIEMQSSGMADDELPLRARYYQSMIDQGILEKGHPYSDLRESYVIFICAFDPFGLGLLRYTFRGRCDECMTLVLPDKATSIYLNAMGTRGEESPDIRGFLEYVRTNKASGCFASELAASVDRVKADGKEKEIYMSLAMDMQMYIEKEKGTWFAQGRNEGFNQGRNEGLSEGLNQGRNEERATLLLNMLKSGQTPEQISLSTNVPLEEVYSIQSRLSGKQ
ncbi:MAG: Rpn family recombination-promoting nuclease/putative transposase [Lachnospiraceae bacterium]|nr:Rpn family recombination-promoting nuclease/putative transposase [Lachnospiraceae bacterium]